MDATLESLLQGCLEARERRAPIEPILACRPSQRLTLQTLLNAATHLRQLDREPSADEQARALDAFLAHAETLRARSAPARHWVMRPLVALMVTLMFAVVASVGAVVASNSALPGEPLYGVKRLVESVRQTFAVDFEARASLRAEFDRRRVDEVLALQQADRETTVEFRGEILDIRGGLWRVGVIDVLVTSQTLVRGEPAVGDRVHVTGMTERDEAVLALQIDLLPPVDPGEPTPTPPAPAAAPTLPKSPTAPPPTNVPPAPTSTPDPAPPPAPATPTSESTPDPVGSETPTKTPKPKEIEFNGYVESMGASVWVIGGNAVAVDASTEIRGDILVGSWVKTKAWRLEDGSLRARRIELTSGAPSRTPAPTPSASPSPTKVEKVEFKGIVEKIEADRWTIGGQAVLVDGATQIRKSPTLGSRVKVQALREANGMLRATRIERED